MYEKTVSRNNHGAQKKVKVVLVVLSFANRTTITNTERPAVENFGLKMLIHELIDLPLKLASWYHREQYLILS